MANFNAVSRTNYFGVKDRGEFFKDLKKLSFDDIDVFEKEDDSDKIALGGYCDITTPYDEYEDETVELEKVVQKHIKEDDACIFTVSGYEKLRYVCAYSSVVTAKEIRHIDAPAIALKYAAEMLNIDKFETQMTF